MRLPLNATKVALDSRGSSKADRKWLGLARVKPDSHVATSCNHLEIRYISCYISRRIHGLKRILGAQCFRLFKLLVSMWLT